MDEMYPTPRRARARQPLRALPKSRSVGPTTGHTFRETKRLFGLEPKWLEPKWLRIYIYIYAGPLGATRLGGVAGDHAVLAVLQSCLLLFTMLWES